ncbi:MAG: ABC transporter permease subunit [Lachnospiraceae bacterium]|nr:sugar ABC transporter permease [Lachnospiraceae bacterium]MCI9590350.1 sugar ABC transporter permease [Lachnospiraceae bacterium]MDE6929247.1 ABC transporter permease subunit [Lachnospiraceae bacterium]
MAKVKSAGSTEPLFRYMKRHKWMYLLMLPGIIYFIIFKYVPMAGLVISFQNYSPYLGILESEWVGLENFKTFFMNPDFKMLLVNTFSISILNLVFFFPMPILLALLLNEIKNKLVKKSIQTMIYIPHFISMVIVASITFTLLNTESGIINQIVYALTGEKLEFLADPKYFRWIIVIQNIWKETGWGMIIFLAALAGVDTQLYEAAQVDGAGKLRQMWHITLPAIKSTIIIMLIMKVGTLLNTGFEQIFLMKNSLNSSVAEVFDTYVYTLGITQGAFSYSTAVGMFKSVVATIMVVTTNWICKKCGETGLY